MTTDCQKLFWILLAVGLAIPAWSSEIQPEKFSDRAILPILEKDRTGIQAGEMPAFESAGVGRNGLGPMLLWDNGGFVTHVGAGIGNLDISMASADVNSAGDNVRKLEENDYFRVADRFAIEESAYLTNMSTFGYEPFMAPPAWTSGSMRIWKGFPDADNSQLVYERSYDELKLLFTGIYRILHLGDFDDDRRPVFEIEWALDGLILDPGEYWIDWQVAGGQSGWSVYVMEANAVDPDQPATVVGTAHQLRPVGWTSTAVSVPFQIYGYTDSLFHDRFESNDPLAEDNGH